MKKTLLTITAILSILLITTTSAFAENQKENTFSINNTQEICDNHRTWPNGMHNCESYIDENHNNICDNCVNENCDHRCNQRQMRQHGCGNHRQMQHRHQCKNR